MIMQVHPCWSYKENRGKVDTRSDLATRLQASSRTKLIAWHTHTSFITIGKTAGILRLPVG